MKTLRPLVSFIVVVGGFAAFVWWGLHRHAALEETAAAEHAEAHEPGVVKLDAETQQRAGLAIETLAAATYQPAVPAYGRVLDPAPLATLDGELASAEFALEASRAAIERARGLFQGGENVARKTLETAEAQFHADQTRVVALRRKLALEWGEALGKLESAERERLIDRLVRGETVLVRVDVATGESLAELPKTATVIALGREREPVPVAEISAAPSVDAKTQAAGLLLRLEHPATSLRPGAAVTAFLATGGEAKSGVNLPREAIVYLSGAAWVYVATEPEEFERRRVALDHRTPGGVFVEEGFKAGERIVSSGAQTLLSEEQKGAGGAEE